MTNLQVLGHVQDAGQLGLVVLLSSHVPLCHRMHDELADGRRLALQVNQQLVSTQARSAAGLRRRDARGLGVPVRARRSGG